MLAKVRNIILKNIDAFTLIELLVVVAIISILATIAVPNFLEAQTRAKVARVKNDHRIVALALETYAVDRNSYPPNKRKNEYFFELSSLFQLTSPISYLENVNQRDVFRIGLDDKTYEYFNYEDWAECVGLPDSKHKAWGVKSYGPDAKDNYVEFLEVRPTKVDLLYDSTNGTVSAGDLLRLGGSTLNKNVNM